MTQDAVPPPRLIRSLVLIGLMGSGKSSVGLRLAETLDVPFVDSDAEIERAAAMSVSEIFARLGEAQFRDGERRVIARLLGAPPQVIATGGGAYIDPATRAAIAGTAVSVWLRAELEVLVARTAGRGHRPLLARGNPAEILADLMARRYPVYAQADVTVDSLGGQSHEDMAARIIAAVLEHGLATGRPALVPAPGEDAP